MPDWIVTVGHEGRILPAWPGASDSKTEEDWGQVPFETTLPHRALLHGEETFISGRLMSGEQFYINPHFLRHLKHRE